LPGFGWSRLAYLLAVLAALTALVRLAAPASPERPGGPERVGWSAGAPAPRDPPRGDGAPALRTPSRDAAAAPAYAAVSRRKAPPVFYRPVRRDPAPPLPDGARAPRPEAPRGAGEKVCRRVGEAPEGARIVFPVPREHSGSYEDTWGAPRPQGGHEGTDLMVPEGTPLYAITAGTVVPVAGSNGNGWNTLGGYAVMIRAAYSIGPVREGDLFYYAHLREQSPLRVGERVRPGEVVGFAGDTGEGPEGTRGRFPPHLHLGWYDAGGGRSQLASGAMNPYPLLEWLRAHGGSISGGSGARYCVAPQEGPPVPSVGGSWMYPDSPGERPDLDTGSASPRPSPAVRRPENHVEKAPAAEEAPPAPPAQKPRPRPQPPEKEPRQAPPPEERPGPPPPESTAAEETASRQGPPLPSAEELREWVWSLIPHPFSAPHRAPPGGERTAPGEGAPAESCGGRPPCGERTEPVRRPPGPPEGTVPEEERAAPEVTGETRGRPPAPEGEQREKKKEEERAPDGRPEGGDPQEPSAPEATAAREGAGPPAPPEAPPAPGP